MLAACPREVEAKLSVDEWQVKWLDEATSAVHDSCDLKPAPPKGKKITLGTQTTTPVRYDHDSKDGGTVLLCRDMQDGDDGNKTAGDTAATAGGAAAATATGDDVISGV